MRHRGACRRLEQRRVVCSLPVARPQPAMTACCCRVAAPPPTAPLAKAAEPSPRLLLQPAKRSMGNCCGTAAAVDDKDNVRRNKGQRLSNWSKTGVIALRRAALTVSRCHTGLACAPACFGTAAVDLLASTSASVQLICPAGLPLEPHALCWPTLACRSCRRRLRRCPPPGCWTPR